MATLAKKLADKKICQNPAQASCRAEPLANHSLYIVRTGCAKCRPRPSKTQGVPAIEAGNRQLWPMARLTISGQQHLIRPIECFSGAMRATESGLNRALVKRLHMEHHG
jgi:hypothetical protein